MNILQRMCGFLLFTVVSGFAFASDPVSWTLYPSSGFPPTQVGHSSQVLYTLTNHLPFPTVMTTQFTYKGGSFTGYNGCKNRLLAPGASCIIVINFKPVQDGVSGIRLIYGYHNNRIPLPLLTTTGSGVPDTQSVKGDFDAVPPVITLNPLQTPAFEVFYRNTGASAVTGNAGNSGGTSIFTVSPSSVATVAVLTNNCGTPGTPVTLQPGDSCSISGQITPNTTGSFTLSSLFTYEAGTKSASPATSSTVIAGDGQCSVLGIADLPLPLVAYQYSDYVVRFKFVNPCASASATLGSVSVLTSFDPEGGQSAVTTASANLDTCSNKTLSPQSSCYVYASVIPKTSGSVMTLSAAVTAGGVTTEPSTSTQVVANNPNVHTVHFINQCNFDVWYGIGNGAGGANSPDPNLQTYPSGAPDTAYFLPAQLPAQPPSFIDLTVQQYTNGAIWPRTGCQMSGGQFLCETGQCPTLTGSATCTAGVEPVPPYSKFEFYIVAGSGLDGVYDVSNINGFNVPVEIKGLGDTSSTDPFSCTSAGALIQPSQSTLASCPWQFNPGSSAGLTDTQFVWVTPGADDACSSNSDCSGGEICGMAFDTAYTLPINRRCGAFLGYSTMGNYAPYSDSGSWGSQNLFNTFNLGRLMSLISSRDYGLWEPQAGVSVPATFANLVLCQITNNDSDNSCTNNTNTNLPNCCGCVNWNDPLTSPVLTASSAQCLNINSDWAATANSSVTVLNAIKWLKQACPTAYSYQFDDPSSSFTCTQQNGTTLTTSYEIVFCPGGQSALPAGAAEGRTGG